MLQAFEQAIPARDGCRQEGQIALDLLAETRPPMLDGIGGDETPSEHFNAADARRRMAVQVPALACFASDVAVPTTHVRQEADMQMVEL